MIFVPDKDFETILQLPSLTALAVLFGLIARAYAVDRLGVQPSMICYRRLA